ncbi:MAG TPA: hypothetical protein VMG11_00345 [Steroidobacteraceae bacterium]|nr:hypothetical protein [Steroidobacteraceae bacterium]
MWSSDSSAKAARVSRRDSRRAFWKAWAITLAALTLAACNNLTQVGNLPQSTVKAVAATVGQPYTTDSSGLHTTVRAGADVVLTGVNSESEPDDTGVPIIQWQWTQTNAGSTPVDLIKRTNQAYSFTAPQVTQPTTLTFQLTVTNANGVSANTQAQVVVEPVRDADHFLTYLKTSDTFTVTAVTSAVVPGSGQAAATDMVGYTITVQKLVTYTDMNGTQHSRVPVGSAATFSGGWSAQLGSGGPNCADARNPQTVIPIPKLNLDDALGDSSGNRLSDVMQTSDVDRDPANSQIPPAIVEAQIQIAPAAALPGGITPEICVGDPSKATAAANATVAADELTVMSNNSTALFDTSASAHSYYQTIDPNNTRTTLTDWLTANGFNPNISGWGADAHAVYTNNYDLGFGRDMYLKVGSCDSGFSAAPLSQFGSASLPAATAQALAKSVGHCDVASVVVNYVGVQAAAEHLNSIVAVAMEYNAAPGTGARFVKFYVFAPDTRTGAYQRVTSVDLDHRGQKAVPQSCLVCHGGTPGPGGTAANPYPSTAPSKINGDVNAGFIPWDLDSFLYSDTDPGFSQKTEDAALKGQYTRANQETQLKLLNVGAYLTMTDPNRFALERELLEGWYGGAGMPNAFTGSFVPAGWTPGGTSNNPADSADLYTKAFASHCRMCHDLQAPPAGIDPRTAAGNAADGTPVASACSAAAVTSQAASADQVPMACYWQFANSRNFAQRMSDGEMPFARRTADRLWVQPDGSSSNGALIQSHFAAQTPAVTIATPGTSIARFNFNTSQSPPASPPASSASNVAQPAAPTDIGDAVLLDGTASAFPDTLAWTVNACPGTYSNPGTCQRALPIAGAGSLLGRFIVDDAVTYQITQSLDGGQGAAKAGPYYFSVQPIAPVFSTASIDLQVNSTTVVRLSSLITSYGNGSPSSNQILLQPGTGLTVQPTACTTPPTGCVISSILTNASDPTSGAFSLTAGASAAASTLGVTVTGQGTHSTNTESVPVTVFAALQAPSAPLVLSPAVTANLGQASNPGGPQQYSNLASVIDPMGTAFPSCQTGSLQVANLQYTGTHGSTVVISGQSFTYLPAPGFATYDVNGVSQAAANQQETISYQLTCTLLDGTTGTSANSGQFIVPVKARVSFATLQAVWNNTGDCGSCHNLVPPATTYIAPPLGNTTYSTLRSGTTQTTICDQASPTPQCVAPVTNQTSFAATPLVARPQAPVDLSWVPNSALLCWATESCTETGSSSKNVHGGGDKTGDANLPTIQYWLEDGANNF